MIFGQCYKIMVKKLLVWARGQAEILNTDWCTAYLVIFSLCCCSFFWLFFSILCLFVFVSSFLLLGLPTRWFVFWASFLWQPRYCVCCPSYMKTSPLYFCYLRENPICQIVYSFWVLKLNNWYRIYHIYQKTHFHRQKIHFHLLMAILNSFKIDLHEKACYMPKHYWKNFFSAVRCRQRC